MRASLVHVPALARTRRRIACRAANQFSSTRETAAARDATRIMAAVKDAGLTQIDHLITTHFHGDHVGGLPELATHLSIREFIDHDRALGPTLSYRTW